MDAPSVQRIWSTGNTISIIGSILAVVSVLAGLVWGYAGVTYATRTIPSIQMQQQTNLRDIAVLKIQTQMQMQTEDERFKEIQQQYQIIDAKLDQLNQDKADKRGQ